MLSPYMLSFLIRQRGSALTLLGIREHPDGPLGDN